jgi:hypothetical protein
MASLCHPVQTHSLAASVVSCAAHSLAGANNERAWQGRQPAVTAPMCHMLYGTAINDSLHARVILASSWPGPDDTDH